MLPQLHSRLLTLLLHQIKKSKQKKKLKRKRKRNANVVVSTVFDAGKKPSVSQEAFFMVEIAAGYPTQTNHDNTQINHDNTQLKHDKTQMNPRERELLLFCQNLNI